MRLSRSTLPKSYDLSLRVDPLKDTFCGEVEIDLDILDAASSIELHSVDLGIRNALVTDARGAVSVSRTSTNSERETVMFQLSKPLRPGPAKLRIDYDGPLRTDLRGLYLARSGKRRYAATQLEAADARRFFPCFDEPDKKARFRIRVTTPEANSVVSNGAVLRTRRHGSGKTVTFAETPPLSTYLIALIVGELEASRPRRCGETPIRVWCVPGKRHLAGFALQAAAESLRRLEQYFGLPYPYGKLDLVAVPDFEFGAMENAGAVTFRENLLLTDPKTVTLAEQKRVAEVIAHELAHMWFGDLVTMAWWDDLWLNEAFATWMAFTIVDRWKPEWQMWLDFDQHRSAAYALDGLRNTHAIYTDVNTPDEATENFDAITYEKGASVVRMVERWLGPRTFRTGVRKYIRRHREGNARAADLWAALEEASGQPIQPVVRPWIERPGFPLVSVRATRRQGRVSLQFRQDRFFASPRESEPAHAPRWPIPAVIRLQPTRGRSRLKRVLLQGRNDRMDLDFEGLRWAYANADESGFYRPLHDPALLQALGEDLQRLAPSERMGLIGHQWAGYRAGKAELAHLLDLIPRLSDEREPEVLVRLMAPLGWLEEQALPRLAKPAAQQFRRWLGEVFAPAFLDLGWRPKPREPDRERLRRAALLRIVGGIAEEPEILAGAAERIRPYLRDRSTLDANLAGPVVELAARFGAKNRYESYLRTMRKANTPQERTRFELALAAFRDPALVERTLATSLTDDIPTQDVVPLLARLLANPAARERTWEFIRTRWEELSSRISPGIAPRLVSALPALQRPIYRRQVAAFFRAHPIPTAGRALKQALERFDLDAELRRRALPDLRAWLRAKRQRQR
ncbi:MAG: M1 family aminopeptidase [Myxococcota bacterium]